jgi:endonuclease YncB( thermonuclease family)
VIRQRACTLGLVLACLATAATADPLVVSGPAIVLDADTVIVGNTRVRLKGVDAAERGEDARAVMMGIVTSDLTCRLTGEKTHRREVGYCFTADGTDIGQEIIEMGMALACPRFDTRYLAFEQADALGVQPRASYCLPRKSRSE